ncbi:MAG: ParB/RepB/Spo0J family partition protein [bacterium]|nr:ParB/RepB/Spo0J family partition protein [bacterium]
MQPESFRDRFSVEQKSILRVPIELLEPYPDYPEFRKDEQQLAELVEEIQMLGPDSMPPLLIREHEGKPEIIDGMARWEAAKRAGVREILCELHESLASGAEAMSARVKLNKGKSNSDYEIGFYALKYCKKYDRSSLSLKAFGEMIGMSPKQVTVRKHAAEVLEYVGTAIQKTLIINDLKIHFSTLAVLHGAANAWWIPVITSKDKAIFNSATMELLVSRINQIAGVEEMQALEMKQLLDAVRIEIYSPEKVLEKMREEENERFLNDENEKEDLSETEDHQEVVTTTNDTRPEDFFRTEKFRRMGFRVVDDGEDLIIRYIGPNGERHKYYLLEMLLSHERDMADFEYAGNPQVVIGIPPSNNK